MGFFNVPWGIHYMGFAMGLVMIGYARNTLVGLAAYFLTVYVAAVERDSFPKARDWLAMPRGQAKMLSITSGRSIGSVVFDKHKKVCREQPPPCYHCARVLTRPYYECLVCPKEHGWALPLCAVCEKHNRHDPTHALVKHK